MKRLLTLAIFFFVLLYSHTSAAQDSMGRYTVMVSSALFVPVSVALQGGLQYRLNNRWSCLAEVAVPTFYPKNTGYEEIHYWRTSIELKYRASKIKTSIGYFSLHNSYLFRTLVDHQSGIFYRKGEVLSYDDATIHSPVLATALKIGIEVPSDTRLFADIFFGLGTRVLFNRYEVKNSSPAFGQRNSFWNQVGLRYDYTNVRFHLS